MFRLTRAEGSPAPEIFAPDDVGCGCQPALGLSKDQDGGDFLSNHDG
jgi:hypothetical protein